MAVEDGYCLVALGKGSQWLGSIRGPFGGGLTIHSPKVGLETFSATLAIRLRLSYIIKFPFKRNGLPCCEDEPDSEKIALK